MNQKCRNDCKDLILFPPDIKNRPGLSHIDYRIGTYSDFREALLKMLNADPILAPWTNREADDPGIALLEGASILGDILTFYQELYANEAYLRTAQWRESIADLVHLLGYRLSPGLGGKATFAFEVKGDKPVVIPTGFPVKAQVEGMEQPAVFETTEEFVAIPSLSKFNLYRPVHEPDINSAVNELRIVNNNSKNLELSEGDMILIGDLQGDLENGVLEKTQILVVDKIRKEFGDTLFSFKGRIKADYNKTKITAFKVGRSFRHFGYNAPREVVMLEQRFRETYPKKYPISYTRYLNGKTIEDDLSNNVKRIVDPDLSQDDLPLDAEVDDLSIGQIIIIELPSANSRSYLIRKIKNIRSSSMTWGAISGGTSLITLEFDMTDRPNLSEMNIDTNSLSTNGAKAGASAVVEEITSILEDIVTADIRNIKIYEITGIPFNVNAALEITRNPTKRNKLVLFGEYELYQSLNKRTIQMVKGDIVDDFQVTEIIEEPDCSGSPRLKLTIDKELILPEISFTYDDFPLQDPVVTVYGNLVEATQGKTEKEAILGNGDSRQTFQTFQLPKAPLTYHNAAGETPPEVPELQIYVNDHLWTRVPSFFGHGLKEEIYVVREDENGNSWVQFGDGKTGSRLPSGIGNAVAKYRTGTGVYGALKEGTTVQPGGKLNRLDKIQLPDVASGGCEPEIGDNAREAAPGKIQSLDRLVSLRDFETEALAIAGISKATAIWGLTNNVPTINITVMMETGRNNEFKEVQEILNNYNNERGPNRYPVQVCQGKRQYVYIDATYGLHPSFLEEKVEKAIKEALGVAGEEGDGIDGSRGLFGLHQRQFGQREYATRIAGTIQNVDGLVWAEVRASGLLGESDMPSELTPPVTGSSNQFINSGDMFECENSQILSLFKGHLQLNCTAAGEVYKT